MSSTPLTAADAAAAASLFQMHHRWHLTGAVDHAFGAGPLASVGSARAVGATLSRADTLLVCRRRAVRVVLGVAGLGVTAAWFGRTQVLLPDQTADLHTAGVVQSQGWEPGVSGSPARGTDLLAGHAYTDTRYRSDSDPDNVGQRFDPFKMPRHLLRLWAQYRFENGPSLAGLSLGLGAQYLYGAPLNEMLTLRGRM